MGIFQLEENAAKEERMVSHDSSSLPLYWTYRANNNTRCLDAAQISANICRIYVVYLAHSAQFLLTISRDTQKKTNNNT